MTRPPQVLCPRVRGFITLGRCTLEVLEWMAHAAAPEPAAVRDPGGEPVGCGTCVCNPVLDWEEEPEEAAPGTRADSG